MWILLSILAALGSFFGYDGTSARDERARSAPMHTAGPELAKVRPQSGSGPVGNVKV